MDELHTRLQAALSGQYTIERELGGGGMSRVFLAEETALGRRVVIKTLPPDLAAGMSAERFTREIQLTAKLQHPQIVPVHAAGMADDLPYYVMPYVEGESLRDHLDRTGPLSIAETVGILRDVAKALDFAHARGVVHRDIKPGNILLSAGSATVADFGIGKALSASATDSGSGTLTGVGLAVGTPAYMAPEQAAGDASTDQRADIYAFGSLGYEMLAGRAPFAGRPPRETLTALLTEAPAPVTARRADTPAPLAELLMRCLSKDPAQRPQSAAELLAALDASGTPRTLTAARAPARPLVLVGTVVGIVLLGAALATALRARRGGGDDAAVSPSEQAIAVLPCTNADNDTAAAYFVDGITGELIGRLAQVPGLRVTPRASAFNLRDKGLELAEIGARLRVASIVECTIRRLGPNVRVTADLVDLKGERTLWAGTFEGALQGVFAIQDTIARAVTSALRIRLASAPGARAHATTDTATYLLYLRGRYFWNQRTPAAVNRGIATLQAAIERDSNFAPAWAELSMAYSLVPSFANQGSRTVLPRARAAAERAIGLDSTLAEAHVALAVIHTFFDWNFAGALRETDIASRLNPGDANAWLFRTWALVGLGRKEEALGSIRTALRLDPFSPIINSRLGSMLLYMGRYDDALAETRRALDLDSSNTFARFQLAELLAYKRQFAASQAATPHVENLSAGMLEGRIAFTLRLAGQHDAARALRQRLEERAQRLYVAPEALAGAAVATGDTARALDYLEEAVRERSFFVVFLASEPMFEPLHGAPRYRALLQTVGLRLP